MDEQTVNKIKLGNKLLVAWPWIGVCPLRSIETGQTYRDFLPK